MMVVILVLAIYLSGRPRGSAVILPYCAAAVLDYLLCGGLIWLLLS